MIKIGDFSKLCRASIKMLRHYDKIELFNPYYIDEFTGYRFYSANQIPTINKIIGLKQIGFSLDEIKELIDENISKEDFNESLKKKKETILKIIEQEQSKVTRIETYFKFLNQEAKVMKYEVVLKTIPKLKVIALRDTIPNYEEEGSLWMELGEYIKDNNIKCTYPSYAIYYDEGYKEKDVDVEVMHTVTNTGKGTDRIKYYTLDAVEEMACIIHRGPFQNLTNAYAAGAKWLEENKYEIIAPTRAIYLKGNWNEPDPEKWMTEIQLPVKKYK